MALPAANVFVFDRDQALVEAGLRLWDRASQRSLRLRGRFCAALSGGRTPVSFYRELSRHIGPVSRERIHLFAVDERFGREGHADSNGRMIAEVLARPALPRENWHPIPLNRETAEESALAYEEHLRAFFRLSGSEFPVFDFILLGIGEDGHTASLFPGTAVLQETRKAAAAVRRENGRPDRVTLTLPVLNRGREVVFLVQGEEKAKIVAKVIAEGDRSLPAARVEPSSGGPIFLLDRPAGKELPRRLENRRSLA
jgi:6-phosphogluconolactonase